MFCWETCHPTQKCYIVKLFRLDCKDFSSKQILKMLKKKTGIVFIIFNRSFILSFKISHATSHIVIYYMLIFFVYFRFSNLCICIGKFDSSTNIKWIFVQHFWSVSWPNIQCKYTFCCQQYSLYLKVLSLKIIYIIIANQEQTRTRLDKFVLLYVSSTAERVGADPETFRF